jgi:N-acetylmuramic acid 6-phosphate etherase
VLDASECPPTFGTEPHQVQGIIAGGETALRNAVEGAEDNAEQGAADMLACQPNSLDVVVGISASGNAPYVIAALKTARKQGAYTACIACNPNAGMISVSDQAIVAEVGPEVVAGSTRLKAGTAQKLILNMITTGTMIRTGKTYGNWMVDVRPTNIKLRQRAVRIVSALAEVSPEQAVETLQHCANDVKRSVLVARFGLSSEEAGTLLSRHGGRLRLAMSELNQSQ